MSPRIATNDDIPALIEMGRRFHAMSPHKMLGPYDEHAVANMLAALIADTMGSIVLTNDEGAIGGRMAPLYFSPTVRFMEEAFWWAGKGGRELLDAFEFLAKRMGAKASYMSTLDNEHVAAADRIMRRRGYVPLERRYLKELV